MSGQITESCRTHKGANRNQCRDSLQSLVGPLKSRTLKRCAQFCQKACHQKACHQKACPLYQKMCHEKACQFVGRQEARDTRGCLGYLTKTKAEAEAEVYHSETSEPNPSLKNSASSERETVEHFVAILSPTLPNISSLKLLFR